jgi:hypothetical protein
MNYAAIHRNETVAYVMGHLLSECCWHRYIPAAYVLPVCNWVTYIIGIDGGVFTALMYE